MIVLYWLHSREGPRWGTIGSGGCPLKSIDIGARPASTVEKDGGHGAEWYISIEGKEYGPYSSDELRQYAAQGRITPESWVREKDGGQWVAAGKVQNLFSPNVPPSPIPQPIPDSQAKTWVWISSLNCRLLNPPFIPTFLGLIINHRPQLVGLRWEANTPDMGKKMECGFLTVKVGWVA